MNQQPTVGAILHYHSGSRLEPCIITKVHGDYLVDIYVFGSRRPSFPRDDVLLRQEGNGTRSERFWCEWPPREEEEAE